MSAARRGGRRREGNRGTHEWVGLVVEVSRGELQVTMPADVFGWNRSRRDEPASALGAMPHGGDAGSGSGTGVELADGDG